jgi:hypothetical protein
MQPDTMTVKIKALCSVPRLGFNDHFGAMYDTLGRVGIPYAFYQGAYWDKCLEKALEDTINLVDLILCIDYDTVATPQHLRRMIDVMVQNPHIDALAANQPRRGTGMPLWTIRGTEGATQIACDGPTKCTTAHFGFTLIRTSALKQMPKPWFPRVHAADGTAEGEGYMDPDIAFWIRWADAGKTLYVEPSVCIGHLECMVSYFEQTEIPSISEQIEQKRAELDALQNLAASGDAEERGLELSQKFISTSEWRKRFSGKNGMHSLGEGETR